MINVSSGLDVRYVGADTAHLCFVAEGGRYMAEDNSHPHTNAAVKAKEHYSWKFLDKSWCGGRRPRALDVENI